MKDMVTENLDWIKSGKMGCTFASYFARVPKSIGWEFIIDPSIFWSIPKDCLLLSIVFTDKTKQQVREWALSAGFYTESVGDGMEGLRYDFQQGSSWVQYFGPDADVPTRRTPHPMLTMTVKLPKKYYFKVGFKGVLHIAHASVDKISDYVANVLWDSSHTNTQKQLGKKPTIKEAAKTTFHV